MIFLVLPDYTEEDRLLSLARGGSQLAIAEIYELYYVPVYQFMRMRVADRTLAEDMTSEVFVRMINAFNGKNAPSQSLRGWLFKVARYVIHDYYGAKKKMPQTTLEDWLPDPDESQHPEATFFKKIGIDALRQAIQALKPEYQEVIVLRFGQFLSLQETADIMGKTVGAIKVLQLRAIEKLRAQMLPLGGAEA